MAIDFDETLKLMHNEAKLEKPCPFGVAAAALYFGLPLTDAEAVEAQRKRSWGCLGDPIPPYLDALYFIHVAVKCLGFNPNEAVEVLTDEPDSNERVEQLIAEFLGIV